MMQEILDLADELPTSRKRNLARLLHCGQYGYLVQVIENGELKAYGEGYLLNKIPTYPVVPWPKNEPDGRYLYCYAAVAKKGYLKKLIELGRRTFPNVKAICYHRHKKNHKLYLFIER